MCSTGILVNTGKNEILEDVLKVADEDITEKLYSLIRGGKFWQE